MLRKGNSFLINILNGTLLDREEVFRKRSQRIYIDMLVSPYKIYGNMWYGKADRQLTGDRLLTEIERVLQFYEEFVIDRSLEIEQVRLPLEKRLNNPTIYVDLDNHNVQDKNSLWCFRNVPSNDGQKVVTKALGLHHFISLEHL